MRLNGPQEAQEAEVDTADVQDVPLQEERVVVRQGNDKRSFKCGICGRAFKKSSHLKQHQRSHTGKSNTGS